MEEGFLFAEDRDKQQRRREWERRSLIYGTPEFHERYRLHTKSPEWRKLCRQIKKRACNRCERCLPGDILVGHLSVHHKTYERFTRELLTDLELLCQRHHEIADREREQRNREAFEQAGEEAREAAGMNTYFTKKYGEDWIDHFGDRYEAYEEWEEWKERKAEEEYGY